MAVLLFQKRGVAYPSQERNDRHFLSPGRGCDSLCWPFGPCAAAPRGAGVVERPSTLPASGRAARGGPAPRRDTPRPAARPSNPPVPATEGAVPRHDGVDLSSLVIDGDVADLWWRPLDLGRAEDEGVEDPLDRELIVDVGHDLQWAPAPATGERVGGVHLADEPRPGGGAATLVGSLVSGTLEQLLLLDPGPPGAVGVVGIKQRAVAARVRGSA